MENTLGAALSALMNAGDDPAPEILEQVKLFGKAAIPRLIEIATDEKLHDLEPDDPRVYANLHAIKILGELHAVEAVESVVPYLSWDDDEWFDAYLPEFFGHIGEPAIASLERVLADDTQTIYTHARVSNALVKIAQEHPALRKRVIDLLARYLEPEHTNSPNHETRAGFFIGDLCELRATEALPAIRCAFEEDRVDTQVVSLEGTEREMQGLSPEMPDLEKVLEQREREGMCLVLLCTQCGRERRHDVGTVFIDLGTMERRKRGEKTKYDEFVITRRIVCPKCGAVDKYELGNMAHIALTVDLIAKEALGKRPDENTGPVRYMRFALTDGREMHPREGLDVMRGEVARAPQRAELRVRLGNLLRFLGYLDEAVDEHQVALDLDPNEIEACLNLGKIYGVQGDLVASRKMFQRALELLPTTTRYSSIMKIEVAADIENRLEQIERGERLDPRILTDLAPMKPIAALESKNKFRSSEHLLPSPARQPSVPAKARRNDPCPCGSGKKYKHCHGR